MLYTLIAWVAVAYPCLRGNARSLIVRISTNTVLTLFAFNNLAVPTEDEGQ